MNPAFDLLTFENAQFIARCPECGDFCPAWVSTENDYFVDCASEECEDAGSTFPVIEAQVREFFPVIYECYPHTGADGNPEIRGFLTHNGEQEIIICTHPDDMKGESLQGMSDYIYLNECPDHWFIQEDEVQQE